MPEKDSEAFCEAVLNLDKAGKILATIPESSEISERFRDLYFDMVKIITSLASKLGEKTRIQTENGFFSCKCGHDVFFQNSNIFMCSKCNMVYSLEKKSEEQK